MNTRGHALSFCWVLAFTPGCSSDDSDSGSGGTGGSGNGGSAGNDAAGGSGGAAGRADTGGSAGATGGAETGGGGGATGGAGTGGSGGAMGGADGGEPDWCEVGCEKTIDANCSHGPQTYEQCLSDCADLNAGPCATEYGALQECGLDEDITCDPTDDIPVVEACRSLQDTFIACLNT